MLYPLYYKNLPYKRSIKEFIKDYTASYYSFGQYTVWITKRKTKIKIKDLHIRHINNIINKFGCTYVRINYPYIYFRYLKERRRIKWLNYQKFQTLV